MNDRGKTLQDSIANNGDNCFLHDSYYLPCKRHPASSPPLGICPHCLHERLLSLVCSDCGEQRLSSCSCTDFSPNLNDTNPNSNSNPNLDVGSVGRVSFLIENDASQSQSHSHSHSFYRPNPKSFKPAAAAGSSSSDNNSEMLILKRSSSNSLEINRRKGGGFWRIGRLFTRRSKGKGGSGITTHSVAGIEDRDGDLWVLDGCVTAAAGGCGGGVVSRSRSLCSFRGGGFFGSEDGTHSGARSSVSGARSSVSGARSSISAARSSGFNGLIFDPERKSGYSESEPRKSGFDSEKRDADGEYSTRRVFSLREGNFTTLHDSRFIDLKFDSDCKPPPEVLVPAEYPRLSEFGSLSAGDGGSCRMTVNDRGIKRSRKSFKSWRWIFKHHSDHHHLGSKKKDGGTISNVIKPVV